MGEKVYFFVIIFPFRPIYSTCLLAGRTCKCVFAFYRRIVHTVPTKYTHVSRIRDEFYVPRRIEIDVDDNEEIVVLEQKKKISDS
jgi:hypothetical protein